MRQRNETLADFMASMTVPQTDGCHLWSGGLSGAGYPQIWDGSKLWAGNRLVLTNKLGRPIATGLFALHTCDNRACVNPEHLYEGTQRQNINDMIERKRHAYGERSPRATMSEATALKALRLRGTMKVPRLARHLNVSTRAIQHIFQRESWTHLTTPR